MEKKRIANYALLSTAAATMLLTGCGEAKKIDKYLEEGDYSEAVDFYERNSLSDSEKAKLQEKLKTRLDAALSGYLAGETKEKTVEKLLKAVTEMDIEAISDYTVEATSNFDKYKASKTAYENAKLNEEMGNDEAAYKQYSSVIEEDCNYEKAVKKADALKASIKEAVIKRVDELKAEDRYSAAAQTLKNVYESTGIEEFNNMRNELISSYLKTVEEKVDAYLAEGKYSYAKSVVYDAQSAFTWTDEENEKLTALLTKISDAKEYAEFIEYKESQYKYIENYFESYTGDYVNYAYSYSFDKYDRLIERYQEKQNVDDIKADLFELENQYVAFIADKCSKYTSQGAYLRPVSIVTEAKGTRDLQAFADMLEQYEKAHGTYLAEQTYDNKSYYTEYSNSQDKVVTATDGTELYADKSSFLLTAAPEASWSSAKNAHVEFTLDDSYKKLTGNYITVDGAIAATEEDTTETGTETPETGAETETAEAGTEGETTEGATEGTTEDTTEDTTETKEKKATLKISALINDEEVVLLEEEVVGTQEAKKLDLDITNATKIIIDFSGANEEFGLYFASWTLSK